ncbi:hypothetical protein WA1_08265 [Scytonema hofmannii PCC 7110]|uniref:NERD domain-containing protein n=1 Tax=Scytonema hofmannii PCC 7110 TaxID=128403 RepID=A0A139WRV3_9CYAN|nr:hypothetical protein [Scytonema hofmannii]KYC35149.1 hypothetical protein WA1_08265 [Scytonema hofmannii PCC 7110]
MTRDEIHKFVLYCKKIQPQPQEDIKRFFEGVVGFPYDKELLLQAHLFLNIKQIFPLCYELLLFEKSPIADYTDLGKCDFVYLTSSEKIFILETKFIDTAATGATERKRRNKHRNKVFEQVITLKSRFSEYWNINLEQLECGVFTTDPELAWRGNGVNVVTKAVSIDKLESWRINYKKSLFVEDVRASHLRI